MLKNMKSRSNQTVCFATILGVLYPLCNETEREDNLTTGRPVYKGRPSYVQPPHTNVIMFSPTRMLLVKYSIIILKYA